MSLPAFRSPGRPLILSGQEGRYMGLGRLERLIARATQRGDCELHIRINRKPDDPWSALWSVSLIVPDGQGAYHEADTSEVDLAEALENALSEVDSPALVIGDD